MALEGVTDPTRFGQTDLSNFLKVFSGLVGVSYNKMTATEGVFDVRHISHGQSVQWPTVGTARALRHVVGENIIMEGGATSKYLSDPGANEIVVLVDNPLVAAEVIAKVDEAMSHYEIRSHHAAKLGEAIAIECDLDRFMVLCHGAAMAAHMSGSNAGSWADTGLEVVDTDFSTSAASARDTFATMAQNWNEKDVPQEGRVAFVTPQCYQNLADDEVLSGRDHNANTGGDIGSGTVRRIHGIAVKMTNRIADLQGYGTTYAASAKSGQRGTNYTYADFAKVEAVFAQRGAMGTVELGSMALRAEEKPELLGTFFVAAKTVGHGVLRPSACALVKNVA